MDPIKVAQQLVACESVTTESNAEVTRLYERYLRELGFDVDSHEYTDLHGTPKIALEARRAPGQSARASGGVGYFCHNDVVSIEGWNAPWGGPFDPVIEDGKLWGRGSCDMKGSAAAALAALAAIDPKTQIAPIYFFVTGDEECGMAGADWLATKSTYFAELVAGNGQGIIGEPTELQVVTSHKGGCHIDVTARGVAAHSSTREGLNANWQMIPFLSFMHELQRRCDEEPQYQNKNFDPHTLSLNVVVENHPAMANITVGESITRIFFRPMPDTPWRAVKAEIEATAEGMGLAVRPLRPLAPLNTSEDSEFVQTTLQLLGQKQALSVCYATDGCCLQQLSDLIVLGPGSIEQAHRPDEFICTQQLSRGKEVFKQLFQRYACS